MINIQFGFVDLLVGFLGNAQCSPAGMRSPIIFVCYCLFTAVVDRPTCVLELHAPSKYAVKVNYFKKPIFFHKYRKVGSFNTSRLKLNYR